MAKQVGGTARDQPDSGKVSSNNSKSSLAPKAEEFIRAASPKHDTVERRSSEQGTLGIGNPTPCESHEHKVKSDSLGFFLQQKKLIRK